MILSAESEGPDQTVQMRSLSWAFAVHTRREGIFLFGEAHIIIENSVSGQ